MRLVYIALIGLVAAVALFFTLQNLESVTVVFFSARITLPASILLILVYLLGMVSGGSLGWVLRSWIRGAKRHPRVEV